MVERMSGRGNIVRGGGYVLSEKSPSGKCVRSGKYLSGNYPSGKCQSGIGEVPVGELSGYQFISETFSEELL